MHVTMSLSSFSSLRQTVRFSSNLVSSVISFALTLHAVYMMTPLPWWPGMFLVCFCFGLTSVMAMIEGAISAHLTLVVNSDNLFISVSAFVYQHKKLFFPSIHWHLFTASLVCVATFFTWLNNNIYTGLLTVSSSVTISSSASSSRCRPQGELSDLLLLLGLLPASVSLFLLSLMLHFHGWPSTRNTKSSDSASCLALASISGILLVVL